MTIRLTVYVGLIKKLKGLKGNVTREKISLKISFRGCTMSESNEEVRIRKNVLLVKKFISM